MQLLQFFKWGNGSKLSRFISLTCIQLFLFGYTFFWDWVHWTSLCNLDSGWCLHTSFSEEIYISTLQVLLKLADSQTHRGPFIRGISSPQLLCVAPDSLPIYYHCKAPSLCPPPLQNLYKNIFERLCQGSVMPWQQLQHYRLLPASKTISCFTHLCGEITKETFLTNHIRILSQRKSSVAHCSTLIWCEQETVMWNWSLDL